MLAAKGGALGGVFRQNGSCFFAPGKGPRPSGGHRVRPRGFWRSDFLVQWETWWRLGTHTENYFWSEWSGGEWRKLFRDWSFGSAPRTMVEVIQRPAHLCLDKSFSVSVLACNISCSRGPCGPFTLRTRPVFPVSAFLPLLACLLPPGAPAIPPPLTLTLFYRIWARTRQPLSPRGVTGSLKGWLLTWLKPDMGFPENTYLFIHFSSTSFIIGDWWAEEEWIDEQVSLGKC